MKKTQKGKKKDTKQKQTQSQEEISGFTLAMGEMDLIFEIPFTDKDLEKPDGNEDDRYYKIEDLGSIKDLSFLQDKGDEFLNKIKLKPNNEFMKQLLLGNRISKKKCFIDFICYGRPKFEGDEEFFDKIFKHVTVKNGLQINSTPLDDGARFSLILELKHKDKTQTISVGKSPSEEKEEKKKEEEENKKQEEEEKKQKEEDEKKEMEEKKQKKMEQYKKEREEQEKKKNGKEGGEEGKEGEEGGEEQQDQNNENQENNDENDKQNKEEKADENKEEQKQEEEEEKDYEPNEAMKEKKIPKFKRESSVLCKLNPSLTKYDLVYFNFEDLQKIPGDYKIEDLFELLEFFKKKKYIIFINFYKNEDPEEEEKKEEEKKEAKKAEEDKKEEERKNEEKAKQENEKQLNEMHKKRISLNDRKKDLQENKKKDIKEMDPEKKNKELEDIEEQLKQLDEEEQNKLDEMRAEDEIKKEEKKKKEKEKKKEEKEKKKENQKEQAKLNYLYYLTDAYFFDVKQACEAFTNHYLAFTTEKDKERKKINKQKVYDYFITSISRGTKEEVEGNKIGLFMDDFNKYVIIYATKKAADKKEFNSQPHPKINVNNAAIVQVYKDKLKENKNDYYSIFVCLAAQDICSNHGVSTEAVYPSFLTALEIVKRKVECEKNGITTLNEDQIYKVKISEKALQQEIQKLASSSKEGGFVLDCTNKSKSSLKDYVALYDYHLKGFFSSELTRKNLQNKGFIDNKGYIMYDPVYRSVMGAQCKNTKKYEGEELKNKIISSIQGLDVPARLKDKEVDAKKAAENQTVSINKKIPFVNEPNPYKQTHKKKKKKKKKKDGEVGSSNEGDSSNNEEGNSGEGDSGNSDSNSGSNP